MAPPQPPDYVQTYYTSSTDLPAPTPPLRGSVRADVCVVGGGIAGCSAALALAERGYRVVLLEANRLGWGASGRSGGQAIHGIAMEQQDLERFMGIEFARQIWQLTVEGLRRLKQRIADYAIACEWVDGQMLAAIKPRQWRQLERWHAALRDRYRYEGARLIERAPLRELLGTQRYVGALYDSNAGHLHPLRYTLGLARAAGLKGVQIHEASRVSGYGPVGDGVRVQTREGVVECRHLLFAGNAWLADTVPSLARRLMGVASYLIATAPLGAQCAAQLIRNNAAVCDTNWVLDYFRLSSDHRLLFGGRVSYSGLERRAGAAATARRMLRVFPQLAGTPIDYAWGCLLDITANRAPDFGRLAPNVYFLQGFSGHGIVLAGLAGTLVAEAVAGTAERFDIFARIPHRDFPGGPALRRPLLVLAMLWFRLRDQL